MNAQADPMRVMVENRVSREIIEAFIEGFEIIKPDGTAARIFARYVLK